ncbi:MAG: two-component sensor histidine kinase [Lachnospiraceae bacterium]|nr:two-component sensor histidine kinase [Lachnospiraceae bacterium]
MFIRSGVLVIISLSKIKKFFLGMRFWLYMSIFVVGVIPIVICMLILSNTYEERMVDLRLTQIRNQCNILGSELSAEGYFDGRVQWSMDIAVERLANFYNGRIYIVNTGMRVVKDTYGINEYKILSCENVVLGMRGKTTAVYDEDKAYIEVAVPIKNTNTGAVTGVMVAGIPTDDLVREFTVMRHKVQLLCVVFCSIALLGGAILSYLLAKPVKRLGNSFGKVSKGHIDTDIPIEGFTETREISENYNNLLAKLRKTEESRQEFVSNVSHELKTPITSVKVLTDSLLSQKEAPIDIYREFLKDISDEIDRESKIISDLLSMVRLEGANSDLNVELYNINELTEAVIRRLKPIAAQNNIEIMFEEIRFVLAEVDEVKLTLAVTNLIENAIKYNKPNGWIKVTLDADQSNFSVCVADSGIGIPKEAQTKIFERFYRIDKARSRSTGGTGLGLSITKKIILLHNGTIDVMSSEEGTSFIITIPLTNAGRTKREADTFEGI